MKKGVSEVYKRDASVLEGGSAKVFLPESVFELSEIVKENKAIAIRGGGSGFCGGSLAFGDEVIVDLSKFDWIKNLDLNRGSVEVGAGVILRDLLVFLRKKGMDFPVVPESFEIASIGGMAAVNAVGQRSLRYGRFCNLVRWVDVVDSYGVLKRVGATELSDFCGMEGTTGIIVNVCLKVIRRRKRRLFVLGFDSLADVLYKIRELKSIRDVDSIDFFGRFLSKEFGFEKDYNLVVGSDGVFEEGKEIFSFPKVYEKVFEKGFRRIESVKIFLNKFEESVMWLENFDLPVFAQCGGAYFYGCFREEQERHVNEFLRRVKHAGGNPIGAFGVGVLKKEWVDVGDRKIIESVLRRNDVSNKFNPGKVV